MRLDVGAVDGKLRRHGTDCRHLLEDALPDAALRPAMIAVVDGLGRAVDRGNITPSTADLQHMQDAGDYATIVDARLSGLP